MKMFTYRSSDELIRSGIRFRDAIKLLSRPDFGFVKIILVNTLAISLLSLAVPLAVQSVINNIGIRTMVQPLAVLTFMLFFVLCFSGFVQAIQTYTVEVLRRRLFIRFGSIIIERLSRYRSENYKKIDFLALINRYFEVITMQSSMVTFFVDGSGFIIQYIIGFSLLGFYHPYFLAFALLMTTILITIWMMFGPDGVIAGSPEADGKYAVVGWVEEIARTKNLFMSEKSRSFANDKITHLMNEWLIVRNNLFNFQYRQHICLQAFSVVSNVLFIFLGSLMVLRGELSLGQLVAATLVISSIISNIPRLQSFFFSIYEYSTALDKVAEFYNCPLEAVSEDQKTVPHKFNIKIRKIHINPDYEIELELAEGSKNYIFVQSYSTMNIIQELITGKLEEFKQSVFVGDLQLEDINVARLRDKITLIRVDQFFQGTIRENLVGFHTILGEKYTATEIDHVCEKVMLLDHIRSLPNKFETIIRPDGYPFSKSQILALQCAKVLLERPKIIFVSPDFEQISDFKRRAIIDVLTDQDAPWTLIFFSQRLQRDLFPEMYSLRRSYLKKLTDRNELLKEIATYAA
jgi:putative ABC transport system ATP-binding protein